MWIKVGTYTCLLYTYTVYKTHICVSLYQCFYLFIFLYVHSDPNVGKSKVPVTWPEFTCSEQKYLEINSKMDGSYVGQKMRSRFVHFWTNTLPNLPSVEYWSLWAWDQIQHIVGLVLLHNKLDWILYTELQPEVAVLTRRSPVELLYYFGGSRSLMQTKKVYNKILLAVPKHWTPSSVFNVSMQCNDVGCTRSVR